MNRVIDQQKQAAAGGRQRRAAFTLIEVMVTLALTMIMMYLFASIFKSAADFVTRQKGIGENDQSARILTTVLKTDLQSRTMRLLAPFHPGMSALGDDAQNRQGYFYYSENNPMDDTDDVLQFTVSLSTLPSTNPLYNGQLYGLGTNLPLPWQSGQQYVAGSYVRPAATTPSTGFIYQNAGGTFTSGTTEPNWSSGTPTLGATVSDSGGGNWTTVLSAVDQPDGDDGVMSYVAPSGSETINPTGTGPNNTGASQMAEVTYFLRHGNLYRRILLIRNPYDLGTNTGSQPQDTGGVALITGLYPPTGYATTFWNDFDYTARINLGTPQVGTGTPQGVQFLGSSSPENSLNNLNPGGQPIGRPDNRFGFDQVLTTTGGPVANGAPREYALPFNSQSHTVIGGATATPVFFGRYTDDETSNTAFQFPGAWPTVGAVTASPMGSGTALGLDSTSYTMWMLNAANPPTAWLPFAGGPRRGEDILLTNVISFDVKIWDNHYSEAAGNDVNRNGTIDSGPAFADVGHTAATGDFLQSKNAFPVYGPFVDGSDSVPGGGTWAPAYTYTSNGIVYNYNNVFDTWYRFFNFDNLARTYDGDGADTNIYYAPAPYRPRYGNQWAVNTHYNFGDQVDPVNSANGYVYQCTTVGGGTSVATLPAGQQDPFHLDDVVNTPLATLDNTVQWTPKAPVNVQAIQITVKYLDPSQNLLRQVTIVQSLTQ